MRLITINPNPKVPACPKCGNNTNFKCYSERAGEDCCDLWCTCVCDYTPMKSSLECVEDVWGGLDNDNCLDAIRFTWIDLLKETL